MKKPRCLFYAHDGYGMGHIGRCANLAESLKQKYPEWDTMVITGDKNASMLLSTNTELVKLPSFEKKPGINSKVEMIPAALSSFALTLTIRKNIIFTLLNSYAPSVLVIDYSVKGLARELASVLPKHKERFPDTIIILGLRGVLGTKQEIDKELFSRQNLKFIEQVYDKIMVYSDHSIIDINSFYDLPKWFEKKLFYTGYVSSPNPITLKANGDSSAWKVLAEKKYLGVGLGSGIGAESILKKILKAVSLTKDLPGNKVIVTGPKISSDIFDNLTQEYPDYTFHKFISDYSAFVANASLFIGLAGYNTISAWLMNSNPALFISRSQKRGEQQIHLQGLVNLGICFALDEKETTSDNLVNTINYLHKKKLHKHRLKIRGEARAADYIHNLVMKCATKEEKV